MIESETIRRFIQINLSGFLSAFTHRIHGCFHHLLFCILSEINGISKWPFFCGKRSRTPRRKVECWWGCNIKIAFGVRFVHKDVRSHSSNERDPASTEGHCSILLGDPMLRFLQKDGKGSGKNDNLGYDARQLAHSWHNHPFLNKEESLDFQFIYKISYWSFSIEFHPAFVKVDRCRSKAYRRLFNESPVIQA